MLSDTTQLNSDTRYFHFQYSEPQRSTDCGAVNPKGRSHKPCVVFQGLIKSKHPHPLISPEGSCTTIATRLCTAITTAIATNLSTGYTSCTTYKYDIHSTWSYMLCAFVVSSARKVCTQNVHRTCVSLCVPVQF